MKDFRAKPAGQQPQLLFEAESGINQTKARK